MNSSSIIYIIQSTVAYILVAYSSIHFSSIIYITLVCMISSDSTVVDLDI